MLELEPGKRMNAEEALQHPWLAGSGLEHGAKCHKKKIHAHVMFSLHSCKGLCQLNYDMLVLFTQFLNDKDIKAIRETFQFMDDDDSGTIEADELEQAYHTTRSKY